MKPLDIRLSQLRHFLLVVDTKNYQQAARLACRSQPAVSQSIKQIESRFGAPLFEKGSRVTLTPFGEACLPMVRAAVTHMERSISNIRQIAEVSTGKVNFAILPSIARIWLPSLLREFNLMYPGVESRVLADDSISLQRMVAEEQVDFAISSTPSMDSELSFEPLIQDQFGLMCTDSHRLAKKKSATWEMLKDELILGGTMHKILEGTSVNKFIGQPKIHITNLPSLIALVKDGIGILPIPALAYPGDQADLRLIPLVRPTLMRTIGVISLKNRTLFPSAQAMVTILKKQIHNQDWVSWGPSHGLSRMLKKELIRLV